MVVIVAPYHKNEHVSFVRFLSFIVCFPVSEAVVESWGSSLAKYIKKKHAVKDGIDLENVGTVDMLTFIRLNGPPPSAKKTLNCIKMP